MTRRTLIFIGLMLCWAPPAFAQVDTVRDYSEYKTIGLAFDVPDNWTHDGITTTTKSEFIREFGFNYQKPDGDEIWRAHGRFSFVEVDSTLMPSDSAHALHFFTIFVARSRTLYKQWLCRHGKQSLFEEIDYAPPEATVVRSEDLSPPRLLENDRTVYGKAYELAKEGVPLPTIGRIYTFNHEERCYRIKIESTAIDRRHSIRMQERIANSIQVID